MEREQQLKILYPAIGTAVVVLLIGVLIMLSNWSETSPTSGDLGRSKAGSAAKDSSGMSSSMPPADAPEWKPGPKGVEIWDVKEGEGPPCKEGAYVTIHYTGWTLDGKSFDSSVKRGEPASFSLGGLIPGWQVGIPGMKPGGIRRLKIPSNMGYGERGSPPNIPPNATLIFEVKYFE